MLVNQKWSKTKTIFDFLYFLEEKPENEKFKFIDPMNCAYAQFSGECVFSGRLDDFYPGLSSVLSAEPETFGAAASRLRKLLNQESK